MTGKSGKEISRREKMRSAGKYDDLLDVVYPYPKSIKHPPMSMENRAAQFAPFAALTGFENDVEKMVGVVQEEYREEYTLPEDE